MANIFGESLIREPQMISVTCKSCGKKIEIEKGKRLPLYCEECKKYQDVT
jgi:endogenous inhibitor of DNA gyrase (YacG/DUF329 family)